MTNLVKYEAACHALAEAKAVDEVKDIRDKADAMRIYAMQAKNKALEVDAAEIRIRAERRLGEMIAAQKTTTGLNRGTLVSGNQSGSGQGSPAVDTNDRRPKLSDAGISKDLSSRAQKLAAVPEDEFESEVGQWRERVKQEGERVTTRLRVAGERAQRKKRTLEPDVPEEFRMTAEDDLNVARATISELLEENNKLKDRIGCAVMEGTDAEKKWVAGELADLRQRVKVLEAENDTLKSQRDQYMVESAEKTKQILYWKKAAERVAA